MSKARDIADLDFNAPDIDGGNIDGAVIGGTTAATGSFTTLNTTGAITIGQTTTFPTTGLISHTNGFLYAEGGSNGIILRSASGGAQMMKIQPGTVIVNDDGADMDFRVESTTHPHALFVEGSGNNVGIGASSLTSSSGYHTLSINGSTGGQLSFQTGNVGKHFIFSSATDLDMYSSVDGDLRFSTSNLERLKMNSSATIFNDIGADVDFRVESDNTTHALFVQGSNGKVGINVPDPATALHVAGNNSTRNSIASTLTIDGGVNVGNPYDGFGFGIDFIGRDYGNAVRNYSAIYSVMEGQLAHSGGGDAGFKAGLRFYTNGGGASNTSTTERMRISHAGIVTTPYQPAFDVHHSGGSYASGTTVTSLDLNTVRLNRGNHYSASNDRFIAPVAGVYVFYYRTIISGAYTNLHVRFRKNNAVIPGGDTHASPGNANWSQISSQILVQ